MTVNTNQFMVSIADIIIRDTVSDQIVLKGKTLISDSLKQAVNSAEIRGGFGNALQYVYNFEKKLDVSIEDSRFDEAYIALNNGTTITSAAKDFYTTDEVVVLASSVGTLANTPVGSVYVQKADGSLVTLSPSGSNFTVPGGANTTVKVTYRSSTTVDFISINADDYPKTYELTMTAKIFQGTGQTALWQVVIPQFKVAGNFELNFTANGVTTSKLDGLALINDDNAYAYVYIKPAGNGIVSYSALAATPQTIAVAAGSPTKQITVYGIRGGIYSNSVVTGGCTFLSSTPGTATVSASGLVTRVAAGSTTITVTHTASGLTDVIPVTST